MKTYGLKREEIRTEDWAVTQTWSGRQSRKVARRRTKDKKYLHRRERRTNKEVDNVETAEGNLG